MTAECCNCGGPLVVDEYTLKREASAEHGNPEVCFRILRAAAREARKSALEEAAKLLDSQAPGASRFMGDARFLVEDLAERVRALAEREGT